jgi:hypothetical protein
VQSRFIAWVVLALLAPAAWGQAAKVESTESEAAMERAKRAAAGPLKAIQQAAKIRRRGEPEPAPAPAPATTAPASAAGTPAVVAASAAAVPAVAPAAAPERAADRPAPPVADVLLELEDRLPAATEVAPLASATPAPATAAALPAPGAPMQPLLDLLPAPPRVLEMVEPSIPPALLEQGPRGAEVEAELSLLADGSVAGVTLLPPVPRAWQRPITAALERWRFEPMSGPRLHRVRLVFSAPGAR